MTKQEVAALLGVLGSVWTTRTITPMTVDAWSWALADVTPEQGQAAVAEYIRIGSEFFPTPSQILRIVAERSGNLDLIPEAAWTEVLAEVRRVGFRPTPRLTPDGILPPPTRTFSHPLIARAVDAVGWESICLDGNNPTVRAQFVKALAALQQRAATDAVRSGAVAVTSGAYPDTALPKGDTE